MTNDEHYLVLDSTFFCCDEQQFVHVCRYCDEVMDCYFCGFDYNERHDCDMLYL